MGRIQKTEDQTRGSKIEELRKRKRGGGMKYFVKDWKKEIHIKRKNI